MGSTLRKTVSKQQRAAAVIIIAVTLLIVYALIALSVTPIRYDIEAGDVAPATLTAKYEIEDRITTEAARAQARAAIAPVYSIDESVGLKIEQSITGYYENAAEALQYIRNAYIADRVSVTGSTTEELLQSYDSSAVKWENFFTPYLADFVKTMVDDTTMPDEAVYALASLTPEELEAIGANVIGAVSSSLEKGILAEQLQSAKGNIEAELAKEYTDAGQQYIAFLPVDKHLEPNKLYDAAATNAAMEAAAEQVPVATYKQHQAIVRGGDEVTEAQLAVLKELGYIDGQTQDYMLYIGMFVFVALVFIAYAVYLFQFESDVVAETRKLVMLMAVTVLVVLLAVPLVKLDSRIITAFFGTMLASVLVSQRSALSLNVLLAFLVGAVCSWETGLLSVTMLRTMMITVLGGSAAVFSLYKPGYRASLIYAGLIAGGAGVALSALTDMIGAARAASSDLITDSAFAVGSGLFGGVLAIGTLPIWEAIFRVSTPAKLIELSDPNHPLLKRLTVEAPGTYHHSILTANLAEAGAEAVGANALLCRVGAYYHDVGKLKNPEYFKENQKTKNPHDSLDPRESAKIITEHLTYGMELAHKFKLPRDVQKIMSQHHGDAVVPYFAHKAQEAGLNPDDPVFKYKGTKPSSKESAVVMLADCVEAAVKSIDDPDREQVKDMITKIIRAKYNEGQFDDCPIGRRDLNALAKAFIGVYDGAFHERIKYPGQE